MISFVDGTVIREVSGPPGVRFGAVVNSVGDLDGDGTRDFTVTAVLENGGGFGTLRAFSAATGDLLFTIDHDATGQAFAATRVDVPGDLDGDGIEDLFTFDEQNAAEGTGTGRAYVFSGANGAPIHVWTGQKELEFFGVGGAARDVDGDGVGDVIVTARGSLSDTSLFGKAVLLSGADGRILRTMTNRAEEVRFGMDALGVGDVNGDGNLDFLVRSQALEPEVHEMIQLVLGVAMD